MKTISLKISVFILLFSLVGTGCEKDVPDEDTAPGIAIYKTRDDYFDKVSTALKDGKVIFIRDLRHKVEFDDDGNIHYIYREKMVDGYILAGEDPVTTAFLSYTIEEYYDMNSRGILPTRNEIKSSIIDDDPFEEYYYDANKPRIFEMGDTAQINEIIRNGEIEKYFEKLK